MTEQEMRATLDETLAVQRQNMQYWKTPRPNAQLAAPVATSDLRRLERYAAGLGTRIPPSFVQLLKISDGIPGYMQLQRLSLRSAVQVISSREIDDEWDDFAPLHELVIASGDTSDFIALDRGRTGPDGEMPVVWVDGRGGRTEFADLPAFLSAQLQFQKDVLAANEADRANLADD